MSPWECASDLHDAVDAARWEKRMTWKAVMTEALSAWVTKNSPAPAVEVNTQHGKDEI